MTKLPGLAFSLVLALSQLLPAPFAAAPALAQAAAPAPAPAPAPVPAPASAPSSAPAARANQGPIGDPSLAADVCRAIPLAQTQLPPRLDPPPEWRDKRVRMYADIRQDGSVADVKLVGSSGIPALDAAALAQVKASWRWAPLICNRTSAGQDVTLSIPSARCRALSVPGSRPPPPLTMAQPDRDVRASVNVSVGQDGRVSDAAIDVSSGNAGLDAALLQHVRQNWHFWPLADGCWPDKEHFPVVFPQAVCIPVPVRSSQTPPDVLPQDRPRAVALQIDVNYDGTVLFANVVGSSGDAGLDAAAVAHVKAAWRWEPISCKRVVPYQRGTALPVVDNVRIEFPVQQSRPRVRAAALTR